MIRSPSAPARLTGARGKSIMASRLVKVGRPTVPGPTLSALTKYLFCLLPAALRPSLFQSLAFMREGQTLILGLPNTRTYPCLALTSAALAGWPDHPRRAVEQSEGTGQERIMALTGKYEFRKSFLGKIVLQVEEEQKQKPFWSNSGASKRRWRDATLMDLAAPQMHF